MQKTSHAIFNRIYVRAGLLAALVGGLPLISQAAYVYPNAPDGWRNATPMTKGQYAAKTLLDSVTGRVIFSPNALTVPTSGGLAKLPVAFPLSPGASRVAAAAVFLSPHLRAAVGIASWLVTAKLVWDEVSQTWKEGQPPDEYEYASPWASSSTTYYKSPGEACVVGLEDARKRYGDSRSLAKTINCGDSHSIEITGPSPYFSRIYSGSNPMKKRKATALDKPLTQQEVEDKLASTPMPPTVPLELPEPTHLPVDQPVVNPTPGDNPVSQPKFFPTGDPVPNPNYDPQKAPTDQNLPWIQPGVKLSPSPTEIDPWRIDIIPTNRPQAGPEPVTDTGDGTEPGDTPKSEDTLSLCEKHPDILACAKPELDTPEGEIPKSKRDVSLKEENLFGGGSCPADVYFSPHGLQQMKVWDWNQSCGYITKYVKPILILTCTFSAFMILVPGRTE